MGDSVPILAYICAIGVTFRYGSALYVLCTCLKCKINTFNSLVLSVFQP